MFFKWSEMRSSDSFLHQTLVHVPGTSLTGSPLYHPSSFLIPGLIYLRYLPVSNITLPSLVSSLTCHAHFPSSPPPHFSPSVAQRIIISHVKRKPLYDKNLLT